MAAALFQDFTRDKASCRKDEAGNDDCVIEVPNHRNEIWNQIKRHEGIGYGQSKKPPGHPRSPRMVEGRLINADFPPELTIEFPEHSILPSASVGPIPCGLRSIRRSRVTASLRQPHPGAAPASVACVATPVQDAEGRSEPGALRA